MPQQINLLKAFAPPEKTVLPASMILKLLGLIVIIFCVLQAQILNKKSILDKKYDALIATEKIRASELDTLYKQLPKSESAESIQIEVEELTKNIETKTGLLAIAERANKTFSHYLQALAKRILPGIWLHQIIIDQTNGNISLLGRTLNSNLVPLFLAELGKESIFSNIEFKQLKIAKPANKKLNMAFALRTIPNFEEQYIFPEDANNDDEEKDTEDSGGVEDKVISTLLKAVAAGGGNQNNLSSALGDFFKKAPEE